MSTRHRRSGRSGGGDLAIGIVLIGLAALLASHFPARRATRVDPSLTLRADS